MSDEDERLAALRRALLDHYDREGRELPWRGETDPYRILVSELMLQQTRVETVKRFYGPWLDRFPTVEALADAGQDEVLKAWEGLGYYRRARNLHAAAKVVRERPGRELPEDVDGLRSLPGVGEYTAGAVASIAFGRRVPAVDGNVRRVLSRLFDEADPRPAWLRERASGLVDPERPGDWNQALMELGATVCTPRSPGCPACPVARWCAALEAGTVAERPAAKPKAEVRTARITLGVFHCRGRVLFVRRPEDGLLGGMWAFPEVEMSGAAEGVGAHQRAAAAEPKRATELMGMSAGSRPDASSNASAASSADAVVRLADALGLAPDPDRPPVPLEPCGHRFTHLQAVYLPCAVAVLAPTPAEDRVWAGAAEAEALALPVAQRRVLESWMRSGAELTTGPEEAVRR